MRFALNDGNTIPAIGFGVFMIPGDGPTYDAEPAGEALADWHFALLRCCLHRFWDRPLRCAQDDRNCDTLSSCAQRRGLYIPRTNYVSLIFRLLERTLCFSAFRQNRKSRRLELLMASMFSSAILRTLSLGMRFSSSSIIRQPIACVSGEA